MSQAPEHEPKPDERLALSIRGMFFSPVRFARDAWNNPHITIHLLIGLSFGLMLILATMENHSRVGRILAAGAAMLLTAAGVAKGWIDWRHFKRYLAPVAAVLAALLLSCLFSISPAFSFDTFFRAHFWHLLLFTTVGIWTSQPERQCFFLRGLMAAGLFSALFGILLFFCAESFERAGLVEKASDFIYKAVDEEGQAYIRAKGLLLSYTRSAMFFILVLPASLVLGVQARRQGRRTEFIIAMATAILAVYYVLLTKSRGAWIGLALAALLVCFFLRVRWWVWGIGVLLIGFFIAVLPSERARARTLIDHITEPNLLLSGRLDLWEQARQPLLENFWTGVGYGGDIFLTEEAGEKGYGLVSADTRQPDLHQLYLQTFAEVGVIGCAAYAWLIGLLVCDGTRLMLRWPRRRVHIGGMAALSSLLAMLFMGLVYYMNEDLIALALWTTSGLIAGSSIALISAEQSEFPKETNDESE